MRDASVQLQNLVKSVAEKEHILKYTTSDIEYNQKGEGFLGEVCLVNVIDKISDKKLNLVIKCAFQNEQMRTLLPIKMAFENEIYFYSTIYPAFREIYGEKIVPDLIPRCFRTSLDDTLEALVLHNLKFDKFELLDKKAVLDDNHIKLIFENYGKFHGCSFALQDQDPEKYREIAAGMKPAFLDFLDTDPFKQGLEGICKMAESYLEPGKDDQIQAKFKKYVQDSVNIFRQCLTTVQNVHTGIIHGDCWSNNMLFKYGAAKKPVDMRLIDFQLTKIGSPICDLTYCLYSGASKKELDKLDDYIKIYHDSFSSFVKKLGSDPEKLFPLSALKKEWKFFAKMGMLMSFMLLKIKLTNRDEVVDLTDEILSNDSGDSKFLTAGCDEETLKNRFRDVMAHMNDIDAL